MDVEKATAGTHASQGVTANPETTPSQPKRLDLPIVVEESLSEGITRRERESTRHRLGYRSPKLGKPDEFLARERRARRAVVSRLCGAGMMVTSDPIGGVGVRVKRDTGPRTRL